MTRRHPDLSVSAERRVTLDILDNISNMPTFILQNKLVHVEAESPHIVHKLCIGSGMGILCSGENSDYAFLRYARNRASCSQRYALASRFGFAAVSRATSSSSWIMIVSGTSTSNFGRPQSTLYLQCAGVPTRVWICLISAPQRARVGKHQVASTSRRTSKTRLLASHWVCRQVIPRVFQNAWPLGRFRTFKTRCTNADDLVDAQKHVPGCYSKVVPIIYPPRNWALSSATREV